MPALLNFKQVDFVTYQVNWKYIFFIILDFEKLEVMTLVIIAFLTFIFNISVLCNMSFNILLRSTHTRCLHYMPAAPNLDSRYSKYAKVAHMHYFCTIALRTPYAGVSVGVGCINARLGWFIYFPGKYFVGDIWKLLKF